MKNSEVCVLQGQDSCQPLPSFRRSPSCVNHKSQGQGLSHSSHAKRDAVSVEDVSRDFLNNLKLDIKGNEWWQSKSSAKNPWLETTFLVQEELLEGSTRGVGNYTKVSDLAQSSIWKNFNSVNSSAFYKDFVIPI